MSQRESHVCADCKTSSPITETNYTLISSRYGWRLERVQTEDGFFRTYWRCPTCWAKYKQRKAIRDSAGSISTTTTLDRDEPRTRRG